MGKNETQENKISGSPFFLTILFVVRCRVKYRSVIQSTTNYFHFFKFFFLDANVHIFTYLIELALSLIDFFIDFFLFFSVFFFCGTYV